MALLLNANDSVSRTYIITKPSPTHPIAPQGCGDLETVGTKAGQYKIPISSANTTTSVYLGEVNTTRKIKKLVLTGEENITLHNVRKDIAGVRIPTSTVVASSPLICSHAINVSNNVYFFTRSYNVVASSDTAGLKNVYMSAPDNEHNTLSGIKSYLASQYAAGTPVTVWYVLAEPETGIVNEPLMKIGDYADELSNVSIPVTAGGDTLSVDTTIQPSKVTVNYKGWHDAYVKKYVSGSTIADWEKMSIAQMENSTIQELQGGNWI